MTLFKQMAIPVSLTIVLTLASVMFINYQSSKKDMMQSLYETTVNNISSLQSKLSEAGDEQALLSSIIDAEFDSGYFKRIRFVSNDGSFTYEQIDNEPMQNVPAWFIDLSHVTLKAITTDVSSGWNMIGTVLVEGDTAIVYKALYKIFTKLIVIFMVSVTLSLIILYIMLAFILRPLRDVQKQAEAVTRNEFIIQDNIPSTREFKDVVLGMNKMVAKVKAMVDKGNEELKLQKEREYTDEITKLKNRKYLIDKLPEYLKIDAASEGGVSIMIALSGVIEANEKLGHNQVDALFNEIATIFRATLQDYKEAIISRMNGTEFILFIPNCTSQTALSFAQNIRKESEKKIRQKNLSNETTLLSIGIYAYNHKESVGSVLSQSDNALTQAKYNQDNIYLAEPSNITEVMGKDAWRELITNAIQKQQFHFVTYPTVDTKFKKITHLTLNLSIEADRTYSYEQFMAPAHQAGLNNDVYKTALTMLFKSPEKALHNTICSLRLPYEYIMLPTTYEEMKALFALYAKKLPLKLSIEMPDKFVSRNSELVHEYKKLLQKYGIDLGIFEFIGESTDYKYLQELHPSYIKGESSYFLSQSTQALSALRLITDSLDISLIASGVMQIQTLEQLQKRDINIIQGKVTESIEVS